MAREQFVRIRDDFDGTIIEDGDVTVEKFTIGGVEYTMDLGPKSAEKFQKDMEKWTSKATRVGGRAKRSATRTPAAKSGKKDHDQLNAIRAWAKSQGKIVSDRGRIPQSIQDEFDAAHS